MGSCLSPAVADLVMDILLDNVIKLLPFSVPFEKKYVDDLFTIPEDGADIILNIFNGYCPDIQFTIEKEVNGSLPFLDMTLNRDSIEGSIQTKWYRKPISSGRILNFMSGHSLSQKLNTATGFIHRVFCFTSTNNQDTVEIIIKHLKENNYPINIIRTLIHEYKQKHITVPTHNTTASDNNYCTEIANSTPRFYKSLIFCGSVTYLIAKIISNNCVGVILGYRCPKTLAGLFTKLKDRVDSMQHTGLIYAIPCSNCDKEYVGLTTRFLKTRVSEHRSDFNKLLNLMDPNKCDVTNPVNMR